MQTAIRGILFALMLVFGFSSNTPSIAEDRVITRDELPKEKPASYERHPRGGNIFVYRDGTRIWVPSNKDNPVVLDTKEPVRRTEEKQPPPVIRTPRRGPPLPNGKSPDSGEPAASQQTVPMPAEQPRPDQNIAQLPAAPLPGGGAAAAAGTKPKNVLEWRSELIRALTFTSDGKYLVVSPKENDCWVFDASTGEKQATDLKGLRGPTRLLAPGPRPDTVYCIEKIANRLVDIKTGKDLFVDGTAIDNTVMVGLTPKKDLLAMGTYVGGVIVVKPEIDSWASGTRIDEPTPQLAEHWPASAAAWAADNTLAATGRPNGRLYLFKLKELRDESETAVAAHSGRIDALAFTPAGLWSLGLEGNLKLWSTPDAKPLASHSFGAQLDRGWLLADGQIAAICRKPVAGEIEFHRVPQNTSDKPELLATIPIVSLFDGFPTVHREFTIPHIALSPDGKSLALVGKSGSNDLAINRIAIYDVSTFMPKLTVVAASPGDSPRVAANPTPAKTTPASPKVEREFRVWKTADGAFSVEAQFVGKIGDVVRLKRKDNDKVISVRLENLSGADQTYVKGLR